MGEAPTLNRHPRAGAVKAELSEAGGAVELHLYETGGHGYGYPGREGATPMQRPADFMAWMRARGLL